MLYTCEMIGRKQITKDGYVVQTEKKKEMKKMKRDITRWNKAVTGYRNNEEE